MQRFLRRTKTFENKDALRIEYLKAITRLLEELEIGQECETTLRNAAQGQVTVIEKYDPKKSKVKDSRHTKLGL